jgi:hypothetical protein
MENRPLIARPPRPPRSCRHVIAVGRMGITITEKRPGDMVWNGKDQRFEVFRR